MTSFIDFSPSPYSGVSLSVRRFEYRVAQSYVTNKAFATVGQVKRFLHGTASHMPRKPKEKFIFKTNSKDFLRFPLYNNILR